MLRSVFEEAAALASLALFLGMIAIWAQVFATLWGLEHHPSGLWHEPPGENPDVGAARTRRGDRAV